MKKFRFFYVVIPLYVILSQTLAHSQVLGFPTASSADPRRHWKILDAEHFEIIYDESQKPLAELVANEAERAHGLLSPLLGVSPTEKVSIAITDITDSSNGYAMGFPRPHIVIFPVLPAVNDSTSEYYDWVREIVTHEYTHILGFEPTSGFFKVLRSTMGSFWKPNMFLPRWYAEGLAVEMESRLTPVGRGRSHYYQALARSFYELNEWGSETIDRINSTSIPTWPRGQRPYFFGYLLMHELQKIKNSENIYSLLNNRYGGRFPWFINGPAEDLLDHDYKDLLDLTYKKTGENLKKDLASLKAHGANNGQPFIQPGYFTFGAKISPDGLKLAVIVSEFNKDQSIRVWTRKSTQQSFQSISEGPQTITTGKDIHGLSWRKDSKTLIFDRAEKFKHFYTYNDLFEVNIDTQMENRLTTGARAREAAVLQDESLVYVAASSTQTSLIHADSNASNGTVLYEAPPGERVSSPSPYNKGVIYSHRDTEGHEWIEFIALPKGAPTPLTKAARIGTFHIMPTTDKKNEKAFYFSGSSEGVVNIYRHENSVSQPITNVTTYASSVEIDPWTNEVLFSRLTGHGLELTSRPLTPQKIINLASLEFKNEEPKADLAKAEKTKTEEENYSGLPYLWPQYIIPFVNFVPGGAIFSLNTSGEDPLFLHQYSLEVGYDTRASKPREIVSYTNGVFPFAIDTFVANDYEYLAGAGATEHIFYGSIDSRHFLQEHKNDWLLSPKFSYKMTDYPGYLFTESGPGLTLQFNNVSPKKDYQISPESGLDFKVGYNYFMPSLGNTSYHNVNGAISGYLSGSPLPLRNVIKLSADAWVSPPQNTILTGSQQGGGEYGSLLFNQDFIVRGYPYGEFVGSTLFSANFEYRLPLSYPFDGPGTIPVFENSWHMALTTDAITLEGGYYDSSGGTNSAIFRSTKLNTYYMSSGIEFIGDLTILYGMPITMKFGYYYGFTQKAFGGSSWFIGLSSIL